MKERSKKSATRWLVAAVVLAGLAFPQTVQAATGDGASETFLSLKCNLCHPIEAADIARKSTSDKMKGPDLSAVGDQRSVEWIEHYLLRKEKKEGKEHKKEFKGTKKELSILAEWLSQLKATPSN